LRTRLLLAAHHKNHGWASRMKSGRDKTVTAIQQGVEIVLTEGVFFCQP